MSAQRRSFLVLSVLMVFFLVLPHEVKAKSLVVSSPAISRPVMSHPAMTHPSVSARAIQTISISPLLLRNNTTETVPGTSGRVGPRDLYGYDPRPATATRTVIKPVRPVQEGSSVSCRTNSECEGDFNIYCANSDDSAAVNITLDNGQNVFSRSPCGESLQCSCYPLTKDETCFWRRYCRSSGEGRVACCEEHPCASCHCPGDPGTEGNPCDYETFSRSGCYGSGVYCGSDARCHVMKRSGESCESGIECESSVCSWQRSLGQGTCMGEHGNNPLPYHEGEVCNPVNGCTGDLFCDPLMFICQQKKEEGGLCVTSEECLSNNCVNLQCAGPSAPAWWRDPS